VAIPAATARRCTIMCTFACGCSDLVDRLVGVDRYNIIMWPLPPKNRPIAEVRRLPICYLRGWALS
jgi:hypothetical protein